MRSRILTVAAFASHDLLRRNLLSVALLWGFGLALPAYNLWAAGATGNAARGALGRAYGTTLSLAVLYWGVTGLGAVRLEIVQKTLSAVLVRPIARWEYLLGRGLALGAGAAAFVACTWLMLAGLSGGFTTSLPEASGREAALRLADCGFWLALAVPLGALSTPRRGAIMVVGALALRALARSSGAAAHLPALHALGYWLTPVASDARSGWELVLAVGAQLAYAAGVSLACTWRFESGDVPLRP